MGRFVIAIAATLLAGTASAGVPLFAAKCGQGITAGSNTKGQVYVNGKVATLINFEKGNPVSADLSQADGNMNFRGSNRGGVYFIEAGNERYEIVEAFVFSG
ncbi:MAG: hypothetical protein OEW50_07145 [Gammaproteobacteria bacterium]|nr:hypothetical protein [Gammaproteobacteria bacterium]MDH5227167.1 hypothetical protein [Gammaproteobacteria bacterium]